ncbi:MAG: glycosyltransferase family 2 protein, partial [Myxococcales bacterium]|nr:glycosyltransferase family 2 protein [Myxococcales bacterium]
DADERVTSTLRRSIEEALARGDPAVSGYALCRRTRYLGRWIRHSGWYPEWRVRLWRADRGRWGGFDPHDRVEVGGRVERLRGDLEHEGFPSIEAHLVKVDAHTTAAARSLRARGVRAGLGKLVLRPPARFFRMYVLERGFLDGTRGLLIAVIGGYYVLSKYAKLRELWRDPPGGADSDLDAPVK